MRTLIGIAFSLSLLAGTAAAQTCGSLPVTLTNGTTADASQVMTNFEALRTCINNDGSVNSGLAGQIGYYAANGTAISGTTLTSLLDAAFGSTRGAILYRGAAGWLGLGPGTSGYMLLSGGAGADPAWAPSGGAPGNAITTIVGAGVSSTTSIVGLPSVPVITRPALATMTWVNQASAQAVEHSNGPLVLSTTQNTGVTSGVNGLVTPVAGANWTFTVHYTLGNALGSANVTDLPGLMVQNAANGRFYMTGLGGASTVNTWLYNSPTSLNATNTGSKTIISTPASVWTRAVYTSASGGTLTLFYSINGLTWEQIGSAITNVTGAAALGGVPTHYGIAVGSRTNTAGYVVSLNYGVGTTP